MSTIGRIFDHVVLAYIRRRLAGFRKHADRADRFGDAMIVLLSGEIERRQAEKDRAVMAQRKVFRISER